MIALLRARTDGLWTRAHVANNVLAGVVVGIVALPLAMAFAIASGARPEQGLYTSIIAGLLTSLFGGTRVQISGPTGAFIAVLAIITAQHGIAGLQLATFMAGIILVAFGAARLGAVIKYIPSPVIVGFTAGIALIIFVGQWRDFFGLSPAPSGLHFHEKLWALLQAWQTASLATTGLAVLALLILTVGAKHLWRIPAPLAALVVVTVAQAIFHFNGVATIGSAFGGIPRQLPSLSFPTATLLQVVSLIGPAFTIALLGAIESLLSAVVADGMTGSRHDSNQELIGQGIANIVAPLFGGFAATGAVARTATNIRNGASGPLAGIVHSGFLVVVILVLAPLAAAIPLCCLSAVLFVVAWNMSEAPRMLRMVRSAPRADVIVLLLTFILTVFADLVVAVNVGVIMAALLFMRRMADSVQVEQQIDDTLPPGDGIVIYSIDGPFFFGAAAKLESTLEHIQRPATKLILRMGNVPFAAVSMVELKPNVRHKLERGGIIALLGPENVLATLAEALLSARTSSTE